MTTYMAMLAADIHGTAAEQREAVASAAAAICATDPTGAGSPEQRNRARIARRNPMSAHERNQGLVGRRVGG